jgi:signal transduction histidine kinase
MLDRRIETMAVRADGGRFPVELAITRIPLGGPPLFTGHIRDITDRRRQEEDLRLSRERLVTAGDAARRRLERDLHDGAQQRLIALALELRLALDVLDDDPAEARRALEDVQGQLALATHELRDLARGLHPATLSDRGLPGALEVIAGLSPVPVRLTVPDGRLPEAVEATIYFVVCEALTNVARHADAGVIEVRVEREPAEVVVEVRDDGCGGADPATGSGLGGLADRVAALGGSLVVVSPAGRGTTVRAALPCAS